MTEMCEYKPEAGDHLVRACVRLAASAPAFMIFSGERIEARVTGDGRVLVVDGQGVVQRTYASVQVARKVMTDLDDEVLAAREKNEQLRILRRIDDKLGRLLVIAERWAGRHGLLDGRTE